MKTIIPILVLVTYPAVSFAVTTNNDLTSFANSAVKNYIGVDITGKSNNANVLNIGKNVLGKITEKAPPKPVTGSANLFQSLMMGTMFTKTLNFGKGSEFANSPIPLPSLNRNSGVTKSSTTTEDTFVLEGTEITAENLQKSRDSVFKGGEFDPFACLADPICSKF